MTSGSPTSILRIAGVSYLNARPLLWGLEAWEDVRLQLDVPAKLLDLMRSGQADVALLPVIDYQQLNDLVIVPAGGIGSDGHTLTVRIFSRVPIERITRLVCDSDSHTSVALARILLAERYGIQPEFCELSQSSPQRDGAMLLIGDKVVTQEPAGFVHQLDLGDAWKQLTGLPFVFAVWMARRGLDLRDLPQRLSSAWKEGLSHVDEIVAQHASHRGWPIGLALQYLTANLKFEIGERQLQAIRLFHQLAYKHKVLTEPVREMEIYA